MTNSNFLDFCLRRFLIWSVFFAAFSTKMNLFVLSHSSMIKYFTDSNLWSLLAPLLGKIQICVHEFFVGNLILNNFYLKHFWYNCYFLQNSVLKWIYFPIPIHYNISKVVIFGALSSTLGGGRDMRSMIFFVGNLIPKNFYLKHYLM